MDENTGADGLSRLLRVTGLVGGKARTRTHTVWLQSLTLLTFMLSLCKDPYFFPAREAWNCSSRLKVKEHPGEEEWHVRHCRPGPGCPP